MTFYRMESSLMLPANEDGEKTIKLLSGMMEIFKNNDCNVELFKNALELAKRIMNMENLTELRLTDEHEWITNKDSDIAVNIRNMKVRKRGDLVMPNNYKYIAFIEDYFDNDKHFGNIVLEFTGPNAEVIDGKLTGRFVVNWYMNPLAPAECANGEIKLPAKALYINGERSFVYHDKPYVDSDDSILNPIYVTVDKFKGMTMDEIKKIDSDEIIKEIKIHDTIDNYKNRREGECKQE